jgi:hypothetical protein
MGYAVLGSRTINGYEVVITRLYVRVDGRATDNVEVAEDGKITMYGQVYANADELLDDIAPSMYLE